MPTIQILSAQPLSGKTTVAAAIARGLAQSGARVRLLRAGSGAAAEQDAATFAAQLFAGSALGPVSAGEVTAAGGETVVMELDAGSAPIAGAQAILVVRGTSTPEDAALGSSLGDRLLGTIATNVLSTRVESVARDLTNASLRPLAILPEDRMLAAPSVDEIRDALGADVLFAAENERETVEDVLIAPVYADPARPHLRRFASKAVLAPFNKTDLHIAVIDTEAACLIITGGRSPSPYVIDRAQHGNTTVLLAPEETPQTLNAMSDVWLTSRFRGERKAETAWQLLQPRLDFAALMRKLA